MAAPRKRLTPNPDVLKNAAAALKQGRAFVDRHGKEIERDYQQAVRAYDQEAKKADASIKALGDFIDEMSPVSEQEVDMVMKEFARPSTAGLLNKAPSVKHLPEPGQGRRAQQQVAVKLQPLPSQVEVHELEQRQQQLMAQRRQLSAKSTSDYLPQLKAAVALVDNIYGTNSLAHFSKLETRHRQLQGEVKGASKLDPAGRTNLEIKIKEFKADLKKYTEAVANVYDKKIKECEAGIKALGAKSADNPNNSAPRPRGPR